MNNQQIHLCPNCKSAHVHWWDAQDAVGNSVLAFYCHVCSWTGVIPRAVPIFCWSVVQDPNSWDATPTEDPMRLERDYLERCYALELSR